MEFFQKRCDMIALRSFQDEPLGVVLDLLYAREYWSRVIQECGTSRLHLETSAKLCSAAIGESEPVWPCGKALSPFLIGRMFLREPSWKYSAKIVGF